MLLFSPVSLLRFLLTSLSWVCLSRRSPLLRRAYFTVVSFCPSSFLVISLSLSSPLSFLLPTCSILSSSLSLLCSRSIFIYLDRKKGHNTKSERKRGEENHVSVTFSFCFLTSSPLSCVYYLYNDQEMSALRLALFRRLIKCRKRKRRKQRESEGEREKGALGQQEEKQ